MFRLNENYLRAVLLIGCLLSSLLAVGWFGGGRSLKGEVPNFQLSDFAMQLDNWQGRESSLPEETVKVLGAHAFIQRLYRNERGDEVGVHIALWINNDSVAPVQHHPEVCYPSAGWKINTREAIELTSSGHKLPVEIIAYSKGSAAEFTAHWFQLGNIVFHNYSGFQSQRIKLAGLKSWPYTVKVMLYADGQQGERAQRCLKEFAVLADNELQRLLETAKVAPDHLPSSPSVPANASL